MTRWDPLEEGWRDTIGITQHCGNGYVAPCSVGICTCLAVRGVHNGLGDFAFQTRQVDVKPCPKEVNVARIAQMRFPIGR
jgi:hypothetical protein